MNITNKKTENGQQVITAQVAFEDFKKHFNRAAEIVSKDMKLEGFRPGKVPLEVLRTRVGDMVILEEAARQIIMKEADAIIDKEAEGIVVGQPQIAITKLAYEEELEFTITCDLLPEVKMPNYKNRGLEGVAVEVTDEEIDKVLADLGESRVKEVSVDRTVEAGDKVICDVKMFLDNVPVDGGQSKGVALILGKDYIIPGFDKELIGGSKNTPREFSLVFPADHYQKNLAGKKVEFNVDIKDIFSRELPEMNDEMAVTFGLKDLAELKKNIKENMAHEKSHQANEKIELALIESLINEAEFGVIPESLIQSEKELMLRELKHNIEGYGGKFADYLVSIKKTVDDLLKDFEPDALKRVKSAIIMRKIIELEAIKASDEDINREIEHTLQQYGSNPEAAKQIKSAQYRQQIAHNLAIHMAVDKLHDWNVTKK